MEKLIFNFSGKVRRANLNGRPHLVADATMIVPGVLNGSLGPLFYPEETLKRSPQTWNNMPILVYHPLSPGTSGRSAEVLNRQGVGVVLGAHYAENALQSELWFDEERVQHVDPRVHNSLLTGEQIELSTGLGTFTSDADEGATFNSVPYDKVVNGMEPDHLAVLPDQVGACSLKDGCGVNNQMSLDDVRDSLQSALSERFTADDLWIIDLFPKKVIYRADGVLYSLGYSKPDGKPVLSPGSAMEVQRVTSYKTVSNGVGPEGSPNHNPEEESTMTPEEKKTIVDDLIANSCCYNEENREELEGMSDGALQLTQNSVQQATDRINELEGEKATLVANATATPATLTPEQQEVLNFGRDQLIAQKRALIERITQNVSEDNKPAAVADMSTRSMEDLQKIANLMPAPKVQNQVVDYFGQPPVGQAAPQTENVDRDDRFVPTEIDWTENSVFAK
jgi:hypothetical protein